MEIEEGVQRFVQLISSPELQDILNKDSCFGLLDKYHLASVLTYFFRAKLEPVQYDTYHFWIGLYISQEMSEDMQYYRKLIIKLLLRSKSDSGTSQKIIIDKFYDDSFKFLQKMSFKAVVSRSVCSNMLELLPQWVKMRERSNHHGGLFYKEARCRYCQFVRPSRAHIKLMRHM